MGGEGGQKDHYRSLTWAVSCVVVVVVTIGYTICPPVTAMGWMLSNYCGRVTGQFDSFMASLISSSIHAHLNSLLHLQSAL